MKIPAPFLFASDLDGTLLPNAGKRAADGCLERTRALLESLKAVQCPIAYISGRHLALARIGQRTFRLPLPDFWVCNLGTEIYDLSGVADENWKQGLGPVFNRLEMLSLLRPIPHLAAQEGSKQGPHKLSLYFPKPADDALKSRILENLSRLRQDIRVVDSVEETSGRALLDIVPEAAGKAPALRYLARQRGLLDNRVFFSGDSGNDLDALASGVCGTLVGNAPPGVRLDAEMLAKDNPQSRMHLAQAYYGDGVIEGLELYGLVIDAKS